MNILISVLQSFLHACDVRCCAFVIEPRTTRATVLPTRDTGKHGLTSFRCNSSYAHDHRSGFKRLRYLVVNPHDRQLCISRLNTNCRVFNSNDTTSRPRWTSTYTCEALLGLRIRGEVSKMLEESTRTICCQGRFECCLVGISLDFLVGLGCM